MSLTGFLAALGKVYEPGDGAPTDWGAGDCIVCAARGVGAETEYGKFGGRFEYAGDGAEKAAAAGEA